MITFHRYPRLYRNLVSVLIKSDNKTQRKLNHFELDETLGDFFQRIRDKSKAQSIDKVFVGSDEEFRVNKLFESSIDVTFRAATSTIPVKQILFLVSELNLPIETNAFSKLMTNSRKFIRIEKKKETNGKTKIFNYIVQYMEEKRICFTQNEKEQSLNIINLLVDIIWLLESNVDKFRELAGCPSLPSHYFQEHYRALEYNGYLKKKPPNLNIILLADAALQCDKLSSLLDRIGERMKILKDEIIKIKDAVDFYIQHLSKDSQRKQETPTASTDWRSKPILKTSWKSNYAAIVYKTLYEALLAAEAYEPLLILKYAPIEKRARYRYIVNLHMPVSCQIYKMKRPRCVLIWKIPEVRNRLHESKTVALIESLCDFEYQKKISKQVEERLKQNYDDKISLNTNDIKDIASYINESKSL